VPISSKLPHVATHTLYDRIWHKQNGHTERSALEVIICDPKFADLRRHVGQVED
jgi:hypothetical protein